MFQTGAASLRATWASCFELPKSLQLKHQHRRGRNKRTLYAAATPRWIQLARRASIDNSKLLRAARFSRSWPLRRKVGVRGICVVGGHAPRLRSRPERASDMHPQAPNTQAVLPACLHACCLLPVIIMDWAASIHLFSQVRQRALYKLVVKAKPSPAPKSGPPCCSVPVPSTRWAASGASPPLKTSCVCRRRLVYTYNMQTRIIRQEQCALALL